jgi:rare lipoprotein A
MKILKTIGSGTGMVLVLLGVGCTPDAGEAPGGADGAAPTASVEPVSPEVLAELESRYPVLRPEPAPEPRPNGDRDPSAVPERVRGAVSDRVLQSARGGATFYADLFEGRRTASGIPFRQNQMVAAHRSYPFGTILRVTNLSNQRAVNLRVVDRGPFGSTGNQERTIIDLSRRAATELGFIDAGRADVRVEVLEWGEGVTGAA